MTHCKAKHLLVLGESMALLGLVSAAVLPAAAVPGTLHKLQSKASAASVCAVAKMSVR